MSLPHDLYVRKTEIEAYHAGYQAGLFGPNIVSAHWIYFTQAELTAEWTRGFRTARDKHQQIKRPRT